MTLFDRQLVSTPESPQAQTQLFDIKGDLAAHIDKLINNSQEELYVTFDYRKFDPKSDERQDWAKYMARVHKEIKQFISKKKGPLSGGSAEYQILRDKNTFYWFYLSSEQASSTILLKQLLSAKIDLEKIFEVLLSLHFKRYLISQLTEYYELEPAWLDAELYINASVVTKPNKDNLVYINALASEIYCSKEQEIAFKLKRISFKACYENQSQLLVIDDTKLFFNGKSGRYQIIEKGNAIKSKIPYMYFNEHYPTSVNYSEQLVFRALVDIFTRFNIPFSPRIFKADYEKYDFLSIPIERKLPLIIIDNYGEYPESELDVKKALYDQLKQHFSPEDIISSKQLTDFNALSKNCAYLVLNKSIKHNDSSICNLTKGTLYNSFWQALLDSTKNKTIKFDYYTEFKITHFEQQSSLVLQGLNIQKLEKKSKDNSSGKLITSYKEINSHKLNKIAIELWLKEQVFKHRKISEVALADGHFTAIKIRKTREQFFASMVEIKISKGSLLLVDVTRFDNEKRLRSSYLYLNEEVVNKFYDDGFYFWDHNEKQLLSSYSSIRVPRIIGNACIDTIKKHKKLKQGIGRTTKANENVFPYYLAARANKQEYRIFLQCIRPNLLCFVRPINKPNKKIEKQNLIYNIVVATGYGEKIDAIQANITDIYLSSFTLNIHKVNETSKSSLFEKIASLFLSN